MLYLYNVYYSILTGSYDGVARVWNTKGELLLDTVQCAGHSGQPIKCVTWISDGEQLYFLKKYINIYIHFLWFWSR